MFELFGIGPFALGGMLIGVLASFVLHRYVPALAGATYLWAVLVGGGFIVGLVTDGRSSRKRQSKMQMSPHPLVPKLFERVA